MSALMRGRTRIALAFDRRACGHSGIVFMTSKALSIRRLAQMLKGSALSRLEVEFEHPVSVVSPHGVLS